MSYSNASLVAQRLKCRPPMQETRVRSLGWEDPLEKEMVTHSSILAWRIPRMEEPGRLQSTGSQRVGHDWATSLSFLSFHAYIQNLEKWYWRIYLQGNSGETHIENRLVDMGRGEERVRCVESVTWKLMFYSIQFSHSVVSNSLQPHWPQHTRPPCPSQTPEFTQTHVHWVGDVI